MRESKLDKKSKKPNFDGCYNYILVQKKSKGRKEKRGGSV